MFLSFRHLLTKVSVPNSIFQINVPVVMSMQSQLVLVMFDKQLNFEHYLDAAQHYFVTECGKSCHECCKLKTKIF